MMGFIEIHDNDEDTLEYDGEGQLAMKFTTEVAEIKPHYWVNQSREMINARHDLNITEMKVITSIISLVQPSDREFKTYTLYVRDLAKLFGQTGASLYERVEQTITQLQSKQITFENDKEIKRITWVQSATYYKGEGRIIIKLSEDLAPYLRELKAFTKYRLINTIQLKSTYSWRIYELLKERELQSSRIIKVKELRHKLAIADDKYTMIKHLRTVIESAQKEIEEKTDISFSYDVYKKIGRTIESFIFHIRKNNHNVETRQSLDQTTYDVERILHLLVKNGIHRKKATVLLQNYHPYYIEENVRHVQRINAGQNISNLAGYIVKSLEENYADSPYVKEKVADPFFGVGLSNAAGALEMVTAKNIDSLKEIVMTYQDIVMRAAAEKSGDKIISLGRERDELLINAITNIQIERAKSKMPPLIFDDVSNDSQLRKAFQLWQSSAE